MTHPSRPPATYEQSMRIGQIMYGKGNLDNAAIAYANAYELSIDSDRPNWADVTRAARGAFEAKHRIGDDETSINKWQGRTIMAAQHSISDAIGNPHWLPENLLDLDPVSVQHAKPELREAIQTYTVLGKVGLRDMIKAERISKAVDPSDKHIVMSSLDIAGSLLPLVEGKGPIDQYRINWECPAFFANRLYGSYVHGSYVKAHRIATQALRHWRLSESPELPTAANISEEHRAKSVQRAKIRAMAMATSMVLPRRVVLNVANKVV